MARRLAPTKQARAQIARREKINARRRLRAALNRVQSATYLTSAVLAAFRIGLERQIMKEVARSNYQNLRGASTDPFDRQVAIGVVKRHGNGSVIRAALALAKRGVQLRPIEITRAEYKERGPWGPRH